MANRQLFIWLSNYLTAVIIYFFFFTIERMQITIFIICTEVSKHYNGKVSFEHQMPTATQRLKTTDECVVSSLVSLVTSTGKVGSLFCS